MTMPDHDPAGSPLERLQRYLEILRDFGRVASSAKDLTGLFQLACVQAARGLGIGHTKVLRYRPSVGDLLMEAGVGWKPGLVGHATLGTDAASPPGHTIQTGQGLILDDVTADPDYRYSPILRDHGIVSLLNVPVMVDGIAWGVLEVDSTTPRFFSQDDSNFLSTLAAMLGQAIERRLRERQAQDTAMRAIEEVTHQKTFLRELSHRNKNDFQLILSLMQMRKQGAPETREAFRHVMDRVAAISMAHDQLSLRPDGGVIELAAYLTSLCGKLEHHSENVRIEARFDDAKLMHDRAVPLGIITNELVTNAIKHAFPNRQGLVRISFTADREHGLGSLTVADDGVGIQEPRDGGTGLRLVEALARQIGGQLTHASSSRGTRFNVEFPLVL
jgi:two-component sensor histidine kinase